MFLHVQISEISNIPVENIYIAKVEWPDSVVLLFVQLQEMSLCVLVVCELCVCVWLLLVFSPTTCL